MKSLISLLSIAKLAQSIFIFVYLFEMESILRLNHYGNELQQLKIFSDLYYTQVDPLFSRSAYQQHIKDCCLHELPISMINQSKYEQLQEGLCPGRIRDKISKTTYQFHTSASTSVHDLEKNETTPVKNCNYTVPHSYLLPSSITSTSSNSLFTYSPMYPNNDLTQVMLRIPLEQSDCIHDVYLQATNNNDGLTTTRNNNQKMKKLLLGGSNFDITWRLPSYFAACNVVDHFNMSYDIYCPLDLSANMTSHSLVPSEAASFLHCGELRIVLQHEFFDVYKYAQITEALALNQMVFQETVCAYINMTEISLLLSVNQHSTTAISKAAIQSYLPSAASSDNRYFWKQVIKSTLQHSATKVTYEWRPDESMYLSKPLFHECVKSKKIHLVGSSHMRYLSDYYADLFIDHMRIDKKHKDISYQDGWSFYYITYAYNMILFLDSLECSLSPVSSESENGVATEYLVLQNSAWDLQYYHPSSYISNPEQGLGIIRAIERMKRRGCEKKYKIIYLTAIPHPANPPVVSQGWRNHASIKAVNEFMIESLKEVQYQHLSILDVNSILLARYLFHPQLVCYDHFLCQDNGVLTTKGGLAYAWELLQEICVDEITQVKCNRSSGNTDTVNSKDKSKVLEKPSHNMNKENSVHEAAFQREQRIAQTHTKLFYNSDLIHVLSRSVQNVTEIENKTYILDYGCFREFPDERVHFIDHSLSTQILNKNDNTTTTSSNINKHGRHEYIIDLTGDAISENQKAFISFCLPYPSLANGMLYQAPLSKTIFVIDNGLKRAIGSRRVFLQYLNITNTTDPVIGTVSQFYLNSIPTGKILSNAADLLFIRLQRMKNITITDGAVYRVNRDMYIIDRGVRRHIVSWKAFQSLKSVGIDLANVTNVMTEQIVKVAEGSKLYDAKQLIYPKQANLSTADGTVYALNKRLYIVDMGVLRLITSWRVFQSFGIDVSAIKPASQTQLSRIPSGTPIRQVSELAYPKYANLSTTDGMVYQVNKKVYIIDSGLARPLATWKAFESLQAVGINAKHIKPATPSQIGRIPQGRPLKSVTELMYPATTKLSLKDGSMYRIGSDIYIMDQGERRFVSSRALLLALLSELGIDESKVPLTSREQIRVIPEGTTLGKLQDLHFNISSTTTRSNNNNSNNTQVIANEITKFNPADGSLLKVKKDMYVVDEGRRRHIASWKCFLSLNVYGIRLKDAISVTKEQLKALSEGRPLYDYHDFVYLQKQFNVSAV